MWMYDDNGLPATPMLRKCHAEKDDDASMASLECSLAVTGVAYAVKTCGELLQVLECQTLDFGKHDDPTVFSNIANALTRYHGSEEYLKAIRKASEEYENIQDYFDNAIPLAAQGLIHAEVLNRWISYCDEVLFERGAHCLKNAKTSGLQYVLAGLELILKSYIVNTVDMLSILQLDANYILGRDKLCKNQRNRTRNLRERPFAPARTHHYRRFPS